MSRAAEIERATAALDLIEKQVLGTCIPFWATTGFDRRTGMFVERCSLDGTPDHTQATRCMVQARQIFSLCTAANLSSDETFLDTALAGTLALQRHFLDSEGHNGCHFSVHRSGQPGKSLRDTYAHAFVILALSTAAEAFNDRKLLAPVDNLMGYMERKLRSPCARGYLTSNDAAAASTRSQNPHMHLLEAMLSAEETFGSGKHLMVANTLLSLFRDHMFSKRLGILPETFGPSWEQQEQASTTKWEPGHQFEWAWLLNWHAHLSNLPVANEALGMFDIAIELGVGKFGVVDEVCDRQPTEEVTYRLWPQTEFLKAAAIQPNLSPEALSALVTSLESLNQRFLGGTFNGGWIDRLGTDGESMSANTPASSLYHLTMAMTEAKRLRRLLKSELKRSVQ